jgi:XTP/dITP diphosphohydrolase/tetrapyrrole methylase family protein/MazG family protein/ATP diphosphatase
VQERSEGRQHGRESVEPAEPADAAGTADAADAAGTRPAAREVAAALLRLDEITRRLRRECPWDREQDERSIVPHTVEEAYELADAAHSGDDAKLLDELGDVLFQVYFLALLLEERGQGDLAQVAEHVREKLIRRHPHVFGRAEAAGSAGDTATRFLDADTSDEVLRNWNQIKRDDERGGAIFGDIPDNLPSTLYAKKVLKRAESAGFRLDPEPRDPGERLLAAVRQALDAGVDPELALRRAADRFKDEVDGA